MIITLEFAQLHYPLFLAGKNHGVKLFNKAGVSLAYDRAEKELIVIYSGKTAIIPSSNIASMERPQSSTQKEVPAPAPRGKIKAQVSTPTDHVFAEGPGRLRD